MSTVEIAANKQDSNKKQTDQRQDFLARQQGVPAFDWLLEAFSRPASVRPVSQQGSDAAR
ncbi:hypothetical protein [Chitinilyticum litopenaei]|uniref:hypothetical protein n=1 Tax=Chitinilyticum litopenaei TaxID=1121276 RepID=UPI0004132856|nr:hypothetical protein [Chitinilyticum litopenaei]